MHTQSDSSQDKPDSGDSQPHELGARSLTSALYEQLRIDILRNRLGQGEKLRLTALQGQYNVSLSVVREALSRLVADGLAVAEAQRGFRVSAISREDLIDVARTRIGIEGMAIQQAIENGDDHWLAQVESAYQEMSLTVRTKNVDQWAQVHGDFHRILIAPCTSLWLKRFREVLFEQSERYRHASMLDEPIASATIEIEAQHRALRDAVLARDIPRAQAAIKAHFESTLERAMTAM